MNKIHSITEKKIVKWGMGYVIFITKEAKKFDWSDKNKVKITAGQDENGDYITIRKLGKPNYSKLIKK